MVEHGRAHAWLKLAQALAYARGRIRGLPRLHKSLPPETFSLGQTSVGSRYKPPFGPVVGAGAGDQTFETLIQYRPHPTAFHPPTGFGRLGAAPGIAIPRLAPLLGAVPGAAAAAAAASWTWRKCIYPAVQSNVWSTCSVGGRGPRDPRSFGGCGCRPCRLIVSALR